jgi:hypothetical protein
MMVYNTQHYSVSGSYPSSGILRKLDLFPSSGEGREAPTLLGPGIEVCSF